MLQLTACQVDLRKERVVRDGETTSLSPTEAALLRYLVERPGEELTRPQLLTECWGYRTTNSRTVDTTVKQLRKKIEADPKQPDHVLTVYGIGYRFQPLATAAAAAEPLFGREALLDRVGNQLLGGTRLITLLGPGGIGKTRVAREALARSTALGWFCSLESATDDAGVLAAVADTLGVEPRESAIVGALRDASGVLLVLDNAEQVREATLTAILGWLDAVPRLAILVTSRVALGTRRETVVAVPPLSLEAGRQLLRAAEVDHDDDALDDLVEAVEGSPLLLELASRRASLLGIETVMDRIGDPLRLLADDDPNRPQRHRSLKASLQWSYDMLSASAQEAWLAASTFQTPVTLAGLEAVLGRDPIDDLQSLVQASVLHPAGGGRFALAAALRSFGEQLQQELRPAMSTAHANFVLDQVERNPYAPTTVSRLAVIRRHAPDLRAIVTRPVDEDLKCTAAVVLDVGGVQPIDPHWLELATNSKTPTIKAWANAWTISLVSRSDPERALTLCDEALDDAPLHPVVRVRWLRARAVCKMWLDDIPGAWQAVGEAEALMGAQVDWRLRILQSVLATQDGDLERARAYRVEAERLGRGDLNAITSVGLRASTDRMHDDDWAAARACLLEVLQNARRLRHRTHELSARMRLGACAWHLGQVDDALEFLRTAEAIAVELDDATVALWVRLIRAGVLAESGEPWHLPEVPPQLSNDARHYRALVRMTIALRDGDDAAFDAAAAVARPLREHVTSRMITAEQRMLDARAGVPPLKVVDAWTRAAAAYVTNYGSGSASKA